jgi:hypothetical protein
VDRNTGVENQLEAQRVPLLVGGFGVPNWGDEYILDCVIKRIKQTAPWLRRVNLVTANANVSAWTQRYASLPVCPLDVFFSLVHQYPTLADRPTPQAVEEVALSILNDVKSPGASLNGRLAVAALEGSCGVHFCGGGYFYDAWTHAVVVFSLISKLAKALGLPITATGVSPFSVNDVGYVLLEDLVLSLDAFDIRDALDPRFAALRPDMTLTCDDALDFAPKGFGAGHPLGALRLHLQLARNPVYPHLFDEQKDWCVRAISALAADGQVECVLMNHVGPDPADWADLADLEAALAKSGVKLSRCDLSLLSPQEGLAIIARADGVIASRYHAMIAHLHAGVPVVTFDNGHMIFDRHRAAFPLIAPERLWVTAFTAEPINTDALAKFFRQPQGDFASPRLASARAQKAILWEEVVKAWSR